VDLKSFDDRQYRELGGRIQPILDTIRALHGMGIWLELVTLLIPGFNDSEDELRRLTEFVASVSVDIPWHVTAFHQDYKMTSPRDTRPEDLLRAAEIGHGAGLRYIYCGNLPGQVGEFENTRCHNCGETLIRRFGYWIEEYKLAADGTCPSCRTQIPGRWSKKFDGQIAATPFLPRRNQQFVRILTS
jgi:pyruvate formate lyase activating enzyme